MKYYKILSLTVLALTSIAIAQHPRDFVPDDAMAVLSIKDGLSINSTIGTVSEQAGDAHAPNVVDAFLGQFFENPSAVDLSSEVLLIIAPTQLEEGATPTGMFGPMPHSIVICKERSGKSIEIITSSGLKTSTTEDGWFIATGADKWTTKSTKTPSPILANLPKAQIGFTMKFDAAWNQFGPIAQMMGGMAIGSMNRPGPEGVITPERKKATATVSNGYKEVTKWCATVQDISIGVDFEEYELIGNIEIDLKEGKNPTVDNRSMVEMSSLLNDDMVQYAMSKKLLQKLIEMDLQSLSALDPSYAGPAPFMTETFKIMSMLLEDSVFSYGLDSKNGITVSSLSEVSNQDKYIEDIHTVIDEMTGFFLYTYSMELSLTNTPNTWDVIMVGSEKEQEYMDVVVPKGDQLRFGKQGSNRIAMAFGPTSWRPFSEKHVTPMSLVLKPHVETVDIDFAMALDARSVLSGFADIAKTVDPEDGFSVSSSPSARCSLLFGTTSYGTLVEVKADLYGLATLVRDADAASKRVKGGGTSSQIGSLAGQAIGGTTNGTLVAQPQN